MADASRNPQLDRHLLAALAAAEVWRNEGADPGDRRRARRRFDYALSKTGANPLEKLQLHMVLVVLADAKLAGRQEVSHV